MCSSECSCPEVVCVSDRLQNKDVWLETCFQIKMTLCVNLDVLVLSLFLIYSMYLWQLSLIWPRLLVIGNQSAAEATLIKGLS